MAPDDPPLPLQVLDIHEEARRIVDLHKTNTPGPVISEQAAQVPVTSASGPEK